MCTHSAGLTNSLQGKPGCFLLVLLGNSRVLLVRILLQQLQGRALHFCLCVMVTLYCDPSPHGRDGLTSAPPIPQREGGREGGRVEDGRERDGRREGERESESSKVPSKQYVMIEQPVSSLHLGQMASSQIISWLEVSFLWLIYTCCELEVTHNLQQLYFANDQT